MIESWMPVIFDGKEHAGADLVVLVDVWREACRHIEIQELTHTIGVSLQSTRPWHNCWFGGLTGRNCAWKPLRWAFRFPTISLLRPEARLTKPILRAFLDGAVGVNRCTVVVKHVTRNC